MPMIDEVLKVFPCGVTDQDSILTADMGGNEVIAISSPRGTSLISTHDVKLYDASFTIGELDSDCVQALAAEKLGDQLAKVIIRRMVNDILKDAAPRLALPAVEQKIAQLGYSAEGASRDIGKAMTLLREVWSGISGYDNKKKLMLQVQETASISVSQARGVVSWHDLIPVMSPQDIVLAISQWLEANHGTRS